MVVAIMPFTSFSGIFTSKAKAAESGKKYTFEGTELEAAAAGKYTDGQAVTAGTDGYFTFYMSAKLKSTQVIKHGKMVTLVNRE